MAKALTCWDSFEVGKQYTLCKDSIHSRYTVHDLNRNPVLRQSYQDKIDHAGMVFTVHETDIKREIYVQRYGMIIFPGDCALVEGGADND